MLEPSQPVPSGTAKSDLQHAGTLAFSPDGVLFVGDNIRGSLFAFELGKGHAPSQPTPLEIDNIDVRVAEVLGLASREVTINGMAVHPGTHEVYLSVSCHRSFDVMPAIIQISAAGVLSRVDLTAFEASEHRIPNLPDGSKHFRSRAADFSGPLRTIKHETKANLPMRTLAIMDMVFHQGEVFVSGVSNEEFSSTLRRVPYPFRVTGAESQIRMYHTAHGRYETRAPIRAMRILRIDGQDTVVAAYTCSPLVLIPLADLQDGAKVTGKTIGDLGNGQPLNMVVFQSNGQEMLFITNLARGPQVIPVKGLNDAKSYTPDTVPSGFLIDTAPEMPLGPVGKTVMFVGAPLHVDLLHEKFFVAVVREARSGDLNVVSLPVMPLPITLEHIWSEFDFEGGHPGNNR